MGRVVVNMSMSVDGFVAGPDVGVELPMGAGGERLHDWLLAGADDPRDAEVAAEMSAAVGAVVLGRRTFDVGIGQWDDTPFPVPSFVLTHEARDELVQRSATFAFVTDGVASAQRRAQAAAGDRCVYVMGADTARQFLRAGLVDELLITVVPVLLGDGVPLFAHLGVRLDLERLSVIDSPGVTHLRFRVANAERIVRANGVDLCVETFGDRSDPAILLVMGAGASMLYWDAELCARLAAAGRFVIRYDHRDTGRSVSYAPGAPPYSLRDLVADATGLLDTLGVRRAHVVGMSMGAAIGQLLALDHPDRVATLTLACSTPGGPGHDHPDLPPMTDELAALFAAEPKLPDWSDRAAVIDYHVEGERAYTGSRTFDEARWRDLAGCTVDRTTDSESSMTNHFVIDPGDPWRARLGSITALTLVLHGTDDPFLPYGHGVALAAEIPGAHLVAMEQTGHEPPPRATWDVVVPALLAHTGGES